MLRNQKAVGLLGKLADVGATLRYEKPDKNSQSRAHNARIIVSEQMQQPLFPRQCRSNLTNKMTNLVSNRSCKLLDVRLIDISAEKLHINIEHQLCQLRIR